MLLDGSACGFDGPAFFLLDGAAFFLARHYEAAIRTAAAVRSTPNTAWSSIRTFDAVRGAGVGLEAGERDRGSCTACRAPCESTTAGGGDRLGDPLLQAEDLVRGELRRGEHVVVRAAGDRRTRATSSASALAGVRISVSGL